MSNMEQKRNAGSRLVNDITVLSLFDGISCARVALERLGYNPKYYASEVDKYAIQVGMKNYPYNIQLGDVRGVTGSAFNEPIDLLIGGSPCQDLSIAKANRKGLDGDRSGLFWEYVRILHEVKPRYFVLENVNSMPKEAKRIITEAMGVEPIMINAALVSAQSRKRLFWTNIPGVVLPDDRGLVLEDIIEGGYPVNLRYYPLKSYCIDANYHKSENLKHHLTHHLRQLIFDPVRVGQYNSGGQGDRVYSVQGKSVSLSANGGGRGAKTGLYELKCHGYVPNGEYIIRKLTPVECERLQSLPDGYTEGISKTQRYKCLGNAFNVEVVKHILSFMEATK
jgi:DNA (cytosine-5)-methyltransferase 3A